MAAILETGDTTDATGDFKLTSATSGDTHADQDRLADRAESGLEHIKGNDVDIYLSFVLLLIVGKPLLRKLPKSWENYTYVRRLLLFTYMCAGVVIMQLYIPIVLLRWYKPQTRGGLGRE